MKKSALLAVLLGMAMLSGAAFAANPQATGAAHDKATVASVYDHALSNAEKEVVDAAEAMPEDKFNFAPTAPGDFKGVRTFALQIKHIAVANFAFGSAILGEKPPIPLGGPNGPDNIT